ncbi:MAG: extracellular solute-binding protein [Anaerolineales bacterium]|nr:extracellular solute-binding protein [Anaerolineales bacterium]
MRHKKRLLLPTLPLLVCLLLLAACDLAANNSSNTAATATAGLPTPANTPDLAAEVTTPIPLIPSQNVLTITVWTVPEISPRSEIPGGPTMLEQFNAYDTSHPDLHLFVELKTVADQGGMLSYLRTGRGVAPKVLPDLVLLPANQLAGAVADGLIYPLTDLPLDPTIYNDLFPAAQDLAAINGINYGYPIALTNLHHLAYNANVITSTIPSRWSSFITVPNGQFVFPAAGPAGAELALQFYLANGGTLTSTDGKPNLDISPLTIALERINQGVAAGFIWPGSGSIGTVETGWQALQSELPNITMATADLSLRQRALGSAPAYSTIPGEIAPFSPLVNAWVWAISTPDPARQVLAAELISWLATPQNLAEWSYQSQRVPAQRSAFAAWPSANNAFVTFLRGQAEVAQPFPAGANTAIISALTAAVNSVVNQTSTPQAAAELAAQAVRQ